MNHETPPPLHALSSKERKYDRQLRLWAATGQTALENAHILLVNSGSGVAGIETLKNLILPGIGQFTILDPTFVTEADLGVNFFLEDEDLGKFRAERCCALLQELNPDVKGHSLTEPLETFFAREDALNSYNYIILALPLQPEIQELVSLHAAKTGIPIFYVHCIGFYSHFTVQLPHAFPIVDTHPDPSSISDMRLLEPWSELSKIMQEKTVGLDQMDNEAHGHVPYLYLLLKFLDDWKQTHAGLPPQNYKEKTVFRETLRKATRTNTPEGNEENFEEAVNAVLKTLNPHTPSSSANEVFEAEECTYITHDSSDFWIIAHAINLFFKQHKVLPLSGSLPDMKAKSADYIQLQNIYKDKARRDVAEVVAIVRDTESTLQRRTTIDQKEVEAFCKSAGYVKLVRGRRAHILKPGNLPAWDDRAKFAASQLDNPDSLILIYLAFLAYDTYTASHAPSSLSLDEQVSKMTGIVSTLIDDLIKQAGSFIKDPTYSEIHAQAQNIVQELVRADGGELHNIAAATGGLVAQEVIKVITKQYVPVDNTCIFDAIGSKMAVLRL